MCSKQAVLVTAAAGGTGQFAVQLAKLAGNTVVATCGSDDKARLLTDLGCDRVINYNKEQLKVSIAESPCRLSHRGSSYRTAWETDTKLDGRECERLTVTNCCSRVVW